MTIFESDIKLLESERLTDEPDGGGRLTGNVVPDGEANNVFPDISALDRVVGRVQLRKLYPAVWSPNTDTYYGAHLIIDQPPEDPAVHATLFDTASWTDLRADARDRLESYVTAGPEAARYLFGDQLEGQRSARFLQRLDVEIPQVGDVFLLSIEDEGEDDFGAQQYLRVLSVETSERTFEDENGPYTRREVVVETGDPLRNDFPGHAATRNETQIDKHTVVRQTQVADAARYYGIQALTEAAAVDDLSVKIPSLFQPLVPATQAEEAITDEPALGQVTVEVESGGETIEAPTVSDSDTIPVTLATRAFTYVRALVPRPAPGTVTVEFRAQGRWYQIRDNGQGQLSGNGAGQIDYATGTLQVTLAELPDVPSSILIFWGGEGAAAQFEDAAGATFADIDTPTFSLDLSQSVQPGSLSIEYVSDGTTYTVTDDGDGALQGDGSGQVWYTSHQRQNEAGDITVVDAHVYLVPDHWPTPGSQISVTADAPDRQSQPFSVTADGEGEVTFSLPGSFEPGSVALRWEAERTAEFRESRYRRSPEYEARQARDDGAGGIVNGQTGTLIGTIDYATGEIVLDVSLSQSADYRSTTVTTDANGYTREVDTVLLASTDTLQTPITASWATPSAPGGSEFTDEIDVDTAGTEISLLGLEQQLDIVPGSVRLTWGSAVYEDRDGDLVRDPDPATGAATPAGSINYVTGEASLFNRPTDPSQALAIQRMVTARWASTTDAAFFRAPGPHRPASLIVQAVDIDGALLTAQADVDGDITGDGITGTVDAETGVAELLFPRQIIPGTARYSVVAYYYIPLDADILGLDPVRLPQDGRVPMVRVGDVAVVHNTQTTDIGAGDSATELRQRLSYVRVYDSDGERVPDDQLAVDLDLGTVEVTDATGYTAPFSAEHRIEDMLLVADVQITGVISFARALSHEFSAADSYLSSALLYGDLAAGWTSPQAQVTWTGEWSDDLIGDATTSQYNAVDFPLAVTNEGAIQERWVAIFVSPTSVSITGEYTGQIIDQVPIDQEIAPTNPATGVPYFTIDPDGWGTGWSTGNAVRFNTRGANRPVWIARTTLASDDTGESDRIRIQIRGDAD